MSDRFSELLSGYLDPDLPRSEHDAVQRHLEACTECSQTIAAIASVKTRAAPLVDPPETPDLWAGVASPTCPASAGGVPGAPRAGRGDREREAARGLARGPAGADRSLGGDRVTNRPGGFLERGARAARGRARPPPRAGGPGQGARGV